MTKFQTLQQRLGDDRGKKVIFLSHCILNENTRYLGGARQRGCIREIVEWCMDGDLGIVQIPCPEQAAWGGVTKRWLLMVYGANGTFFYRLRRLFLALFLLYTRLVYQSLAQKVVNQITDYLDSGYSVIGIIGIDGSPSCGLNTTMDLDKSLELTSRIDISSVTVAQMNSIIRQSLTDGRGLLTAALQRELNQRHIDLPYAAHDLLAELDGKSSTAAAYFCPS